MTMKKFKSEIKGHLGIIVTENKDELDGEKMQWNEVLIHGDPDGLKSFAKLLWFIRKLLSGDLTL